MRTDLLLHVNCEPYNVYRLQVSAASQRHPSPLHALTTRSRRFFFASNVSWVPTERFAGCSNQSRERDFTPCLAMSSSPRRQSPRSKARRLEAISDAPRLADVAVMLAAHDEAAYVERFVTAKTRGCARAVVRMLGHASCLQLVPSTVTDTNARATFYRIDAALRSGHCDHDESSRSDWTAWLDFELDYGNDPTRLRALLLILRHEAAERRDAEAARDAAVPGEPAQKACRAESRRPRE